MRAFIDGHRCHTPYFLEISQEFVRFLLERSCPHPDDPPFIAELAHYEWVELALTVAEDDIPPEAGGDPMSSPLTLSPLAWPLAYSYPVHQIGVDFRPTEPGDTVYLVVYRDRADAVQFMALNAATARLLELVRERGPEPGRAAAGAGGGTVIAGGHGHRLWRGPAGGLCGPRHSCHALRGTFPCCSALLTGVIFRG